jgi:acyl-homoserine lactone synthase
MLHVVTAQNRRHYTRPLWQMFQIRKRHYVDERGWAELWSFSGGELDDSDDERAVYILALSDEEDLQGFVRIRPTDDRSILVDKFPYLIDAGQPVLKGPRTWEGARIWFDARAGEPHAGMHRLLTGAAEHILASGGDRLLAFIDVQNFPHLTDGALEFKMTGPPAPYRYGVMVGVKHEVSELQVTRMRDSLGEPPPLTYLADDEDMRAFGSIGRIQHEVDLARHIDLAEAKIDLATPAKTKASISANFARYDACIAGIWSRPVEEDEAEADAPESAIEPDPGESSAA